MLMLNCRRRWKCRESKLGTIALSHYLWNPEILLHDVANLLTKLELVVLQESHQIRNVELALGQPLVALQGDG